MIVKHIFYGTKHYKKYEMGSRYNPFIDSLSHFYPNCEKIGEVDRIEVYIINLYYKTEDVIIGESELINERVLEKSYIELNGEKLYANKVVQKDNGDVLCYTNKTVEIINDEVFTKEKAIKDAEECLNKLKIEHENQNQEDKTNKKKWYKFWK